MVIADMVTSEHSRVPWKRTALILGCLVLVGLLIRMVCFVGVGTSDSMRYVIAAGNLADGHCPVQQDPLVYTRPGFLLFISPIVAVSGYTSCGPALYTLACSLGVIVLTYAIASVLAGSKAALWATAVVGFSTLAIIYGTSVLPDVPLTFWAMLSLLLLLRARDADTKKKVMLLCFAAGVTLGIGWVTKLTIVFLVPIALLAVAAIKGRRKTAVLAGLAGFALIVILEMGYWTAIAGEPFMRFQVLTGHVSSASPGQTFQRNSLWEFPIKMFLIISEDGLLYYLLVPALFWTVSRRARQLWFPMAWCGVFFLCAQFGSTRLTSYRPFPHNPRYLMPLVPAGAILIGAWLATVARSRRRTAVALFCVYAGPSLLLAYLAPPTTGHISVVAAERAARLLEDKKAKAVFADWKFCRSLNYFARNPDSRLPDAQPWLDSDLKTTVDLHERPGAYVCRFDEGLRRNTAEKGGVDLDQVYGWLEKNARKETHTLDYGRNQRILLGGMWAVLKRLPLPGRVHKRLENAFSRHLADPVITIYHIGKVPA